MKIKQIDETFKINVGAPTPTILSNELDIYLIFYVEKYDPNWDGTSIHMRTDQDEGIVTIRFKGFDQFKFGSPNDEAMNGHPLYNLGLEPYSIQEVIDSDWIEELRKMNSVHPYHRDESFDSCKHFIFFFHDTCFEIVADNYTVEKNSLPSMKEEIRRVSQLL